MDPGKTAAALNYYWGVVIEEIHQETGESKTRLHTLFKRAFLARPEFTPAGDLELTQGTTKGINKQNFNDFVTYVIIEAATELGITVRPPLKSEILTPNEN